MVIPDWITSKPRKAKRAPKKKEVAGPYRSQSSVPKVRHAATKHEHRKAPAPPPPRKASHALDVPDIHVPSKSELRKAKRVEKQLRLARRALAIPKVKQAHTPAPPNLQTAKIRNTKGGGWKPPSPTELAVQKDVIQPLQEKGKLPEHETTGQQIYDKIAEWGPTVLTGGPELKAAMKSLSLAARGAEAGGTKVGGLKALSRIVTPTKVDTAESRAAVAASAKSRVAGMANREETLTQKAGAAARSTLKKARRVAPKEEKALARQITGTVTRREAVAQAGAPLKLTKAAASQNLAVVRGHEQAITHDFPHGLGKTTKTTLRALPGFVTVPVGIAAHVGVSAGRAGSETLHAAGVPGFKGYSGSEIVAPLKYEGKAQIDFAKEVASVVTSGDSKYVQKQVEDNLGLLLPITAGLGVKAITDRVAAERIVTKVRGLAEKVRRTERLGLKPHGDLHGQPRVFEKAGQHKAEARAAANTRLKIKGEFADRSRGVTRHATRAKGTVVLRRTAKGNEVVIHAGDTVPFMVRHGIPLDNPKLALKEIKRIHAHLQEPDAPLPKDVLTTRDVTSTLIEHPNWLKDPHLRAAVDAARAQEHYARTTPGLSPDHSEAARHSSVAVTHDIPHASERFPQSVKPIVRAKEKVGQDARKTLLKEAKEDRAAALTIEKHGPGNPVEQGAAAHLRDQAAAKVEAARAMKSDPAVHAELTQAMVNDVQKVIKQKGLAQPEYAYTGVAREVPTHGAGGQKFSRVPGKSKRKSGRAELTGSVREGLGPYVHDSIGAPVARRHIFAAIRDFLSRNQVKAGDKAVFNGSEARALFDDPASGVTRDSHVLIPTQLTKRAFDFISKETSDLHPGDKWVKEMQGVFSKSEQDRLLKSGKKAGRTYHIVRRPAAEEFFNQMTSARMNRTIARVNHATSYLILGTSPAWAVMQVAAEYAQAAAAEPKLLNPAYVKKLVNAYHNMAPHKRQEFESWVGVTTRNVEHAHDVQLGMETASDMAGAAAAFSVLNRTPGGRLIRSIPNTITAIDQWKGGRIRVLTAAAKIDREMNGHLNGFLRGTGGLYREQAKISEQLKGQPLSKQLEFWADHPKAVARYQSYLDDMLGNWTALTMNERVASQMAIFYPFMRMSLRWTFYAFPKHHPLRAAASYWLGQQNANELHKLLRGDPSFFTQWGTFPLHLGKNETGLLDLSRIAPGSNALVEAFGGNISGPLGTVALRLAQPAIGAGVTAGLGINPLTGKQEPHSLAHGANEVLSLSPIARTGEKLLLPKDQKRAEGSVELFGSTERQNSLDKLFAKLRDPELQQTIRTLAFPALPKNTEHEADVAHLGRILGTLSDNGSSKRREVAQKLADGKTPVPKAEAQVAKMEKAYDQANKELDRLFKKYGVDYKPEEKKFLKRYGEIYYGPQKEPSAKAKLEEEIGLEPQPSKSEIEEELGLEPAPTKRQLEKELGL